MELLGPVVVWATVLIPITAGYLAHRKGYNFALWALAGGAFSFILFALAFLLENAELAAIAGYSGPWSIAGGLFSLITLAFMPFANKADQRPEESARLKRTGNWIAGGVTALVAVITFAH